MLAVWWFLIIAPTIVNMIGLFFTVFLEPAHVVLVQFIQHGCRQWCWTLLLGGLLAIYQLEERNIIYLAETVI